MRTITYAALLIALMGATVACNQSAPDTVKSESRTKVQTPEGTQTTTSTTEQVGSTSTSKTETEVKTPEGTVESKLETVVGTVTLYTAGKKIEILTGESDTHSFDLSDAKVRFTIDPAVVVGSKVKLDQRTQDNGDKEVEVHLLEV
ncbi:MAG: hypothetical protein ABI689_02235 [Thermoanaerobaculia bacterium]